MEISAPLIALLGALFGGVVSSVLTHAFTTQRFYSQKWWERKADVYSTILETLSELLAQEDFELNNLEDGRSVDEDTQRLIRNRRLPAQWRLSQLENIGAFVASEDVAKHLKLTLKVLSDHSDDAIKQDASDTAASDKIYKAYHTKNRAALQKAINDIRACGRRELQGRTWWKRVLCG